MATVTLLLATAGTLFSPLLSVVVVPALLYLTMPAIRQSYTALVHEQRISFALVNVTLPAFCLFHGYYTALALNFLLTSCGRYLLVVNTSQTRQQLQQIFGQLPYTVWVVCNGIEVEIPLTAVKPGDRVIVNAGNLIPVDGTVIQGGALVAETALTCRSQPVEKGVGDAVFAATLVMVGKVWIRAENVATQTAVAQLEQRLHTAAHYDEGHLTDPMTLPTLGVGALAAFLLNPLSAMTLLYARLGYDLEALLPVGWLHFLQTTAKAGVLLTTPILLTRLPQIDVLIFSYAVSQHAETAATIRALRDDRRYFIAIVGVPPTLPASSLGFLAVDALFYEEAMQSQAAVIAQLQAEGRCVCYVGDGLDDALLMQQADVGVSLRGVADLAANEAQVILLEPSLHRLHYLLRAAASFQDEVQKTFYLTYLPGVLTLAGVLFLHTDLFSAILINNVGLFLAMRQEMRTLLAEEWTRIENCLESLSDFPHLLGNALAHTRTVQS
ncbi:MAG: hypothetical protein ACOYNY_43300 [Caldilineaceae bacterium]